jgi:hypothetical protein
MTRHSTITRTEVGHRGGGSMISVGMYPTRSDDAQLAEMLLWAAGIPYVTETGDAGSAYPFDPVERLRLLVGEADAEDATRALT